MRRFLLVYIIIALYSFQIIAQEDYARYLNSAYSTLNEGKIEDAQRQYNVFKRMTNKNDPVFESLLKEKQEEINTPSKNTSGVENGHKWVDLGLSVKWATCNVGASKPEYAGDYYAWGEVVTKREYNSDNYKHSGLFAIKKYVTDKGKGLVGNGKVDGKSSLDSEDDVAHVKWGGTWRIPTKEELEELRVECTWKWTYNNGVYGCEVTSNKAGFKDCSIFIPASGYKTGKDLRNNNEIGYFWSNTLETDGSQSSAWRLAFDDFDANVTYMFRSRGLPIRPVCK